MKEIARAHALAQLAENSLPDQQRHTLAQAFAQHCDSYPGKEGTLMAQAMGLDSATMLEGAVRNLWTAFWAGIEASPILSMRPN